MGGARFDPSRAVTFDLDTGLVHLEGAPGRVLVPAAALGALCIAAGPEAAAAMGRDMGTAMGRRLAARLSPAAEDAAAADPGGGVRSASLETVVEHLGGELALSGLGALSAERWGRALVMVVDHSPLGAEGDALLEALLGAALETAAGRAVRALRLARDAARARFLIGGDAAVARVRGWLAEGATWGDALERARRAHEAAEMEAAEMEAAEAAEQAHLAGEAESSEPAPASSRIPKPKHTAVGEDLPGEPFGDLDLDEDEPPPESGEVASQRKPGGFDETLDSTEGWTGDVEGTSFVQEVRPAAPTTFGELLDATLALGDPHNDP